MTSRSSSISPSQIGTFRDLNTSIKTVSRVTFCAKVVHLSLFVHPAQSVHKPLHFVSRHYSCRLDKTERVYTGALNSEDKTIECIKLATFLLCLSSWGLSSRYISYILHVVVCIDS